MKYFEFLLLLWLRCVAVGGGVITTRYCAHDYTSIDWNDSMLHLKLIFEGFETHSFSGDLNRPRHQKATLQVLSQGIVTGDPITARPMKVHSIHSARECVG